MGVYVGEKVDYGPEKSLLTVELKHFGCYKFAIRRNCYLRGFM